MFTTRFAPSPTGNLHIGSVRTAFFAWIFAKSNDGKCFLRIEDTDKERYNEKSVADIITSFKWLGINFDDKVFYQSNNYKKHREVASVLLDKGLAYHCHCDVNRLNNIRQQQLKQGNIPKYDGYCRNLKLAETPSSTVRFAMPLSGIVYFCDLIKSNITIKNEQLDDLILLRSDKNPTYNFAVVVDDYDMGINFVIRGDDHINNTPKQINIYKALGWQVPKFAHMPMILDEKGVKLSKRNIEQAGIQYYINKGFLPEAILNYLVRLCWSYGDREIFSSKEIIDFFSIKDINQSAARFDFKKMLWFNQYYLHKKNDNELVSYLKNELEKLHLNIDDIPLEKVIALIKLRSTTLVDLVQQAKIFYQNNIIYNDDIIAKVIKENSYFLLKKIFDLLEKIDSWQVDNIKQVINLVCKNEKVGFADVGKPLRLAIIGKIDAPNIVDITYLIGKNKTLKHINLFLDKIKT